MDKHTDGTFVLSYQNKFSTPQLLQLHCALHEAGAHSAAEYLPPLSPNTLANFLASPSTLEFLWRQRILYPTLAIAASLGIDIPSDYHRAAELICVTNAIQREAVEQFSKAVAESGAPLSAIKGTALYLDHSTPRHMVDFDFLFQISDLSLVLEVCRSQGFISGALDRRNVCLIPSTQDDLEVLLNSHYEIPLQCKLIKDPNLDRFFDLASSLDCNPYLAVAGKVTLSVALDLHFNLSSEFDAGDAWHGVLPLDKVGGSPFRPQAADLLWFLAARCYHEVMQLNKYSFRQFLDVLTVLRLYREEIDWDRVLSMTHKYDLHPSIYYILHHCRSANKDLVPQHVIDMTYPAGPGRSRFHDWGDCLPKLLGAVAVSNVFSHTRQGS